MESSGGQQHEFVVNGYAYLRVRKTVKAESQDAAKRKAKRSNTGWTITESPRGATVDVLSVLPPEGLNAAAMRRVGIDVEQRPSSRKPVFMIPTEGKTEDQLADEVVAALRAQGIEVDDDE
jgi:hypothetical protein